MALSGRLMQGKAVTIEVCSAHRDRNIHFYGSAKLRTANWNLVPRVKSDIYILDTLDS